VRPSSLAELISLTPLQFTVVFDQVFSTTACSSDKAA
jgi:hypothetical protein